MKLLGLDITKYWNEEGVEEEEELPEAKRFKADTLLDEPVLTEVV